MRFGGQGLLPLFRVVRLVASLLWRSRTSCRPFEARSGEARLRAINCRLTCVERHS